MKPPWKIYCWEPTLSPHKSDLFVALQADPNVGRLVQICEENIAPSRVAMGWTLPKSAAQIATVLGPNAAQVREIITDSERDAVHIFSGLRWVPSIVTGLAEARRQRRRFGLMSEPRAFDGSLGLVRLAHSWISEGMQRRHADFVLAIGRQGPSWFRMAGYAPAKIFPFAYFSKLPSVSEVPPRSGKTLVGYLGRLTRAKGLKLFLDAVMHGLRDYDVVIAGAGELEPEVRAVSANSNGRIRFESAIPMANVYRFLSSVDILVQPSLTKDGWGMVVSEALTAGAAVIASERVGASICLDESNNGSVLRNLTPEALADTIDALISAGATSTQAREARRDWAMARLTAESGARSLLDVLDHVYGNQPRPPSFLDRKMQGAECVF